MSQQIPQSTEKESEDGGKVSEYDSAFYKLIEEIDSKLQSGKALDMNYVNITFQTFLMDLDIDASVASTYRKEKLKNQLVKHYGTKIVFQPQLNPSLPELVFSNGAKLQDVINTSSKLRQNVKFQDVEDEFQTTSDPAMRLKESYTLLPRYYRKNCKPLLLFSTVLSTLTTSLRIMQKQLCQTNFSVSCIY